MRIGKKEAKALADHIDRLKSTAHVVDMMGTELAGILTGVTLRINMAIRDHNAARAAAAVFVSEVHDTLEEEYDEKSDKWKEGDAGSAAAEMVSAWDDVDLDPLDLVHVLMPDLPKPDFKKLEELPDESDQ